MSKTPLFNEFSEMSSKAWKQKIQVDLKGADYNETLVWESPEGIKVKPFYHADDIKNATLSSNSPNSWAVGQTIYAQNAIMANEKAMIALHRGVEVLCFVIPNDEVNIEVLLKNIDVTITPIHFELQFLSKSYVQNIMAYIDDDAKNTIFLNIDILGNLAKSGNWYFNLKKDHEILTDILKETSTNILSVDISLYENAGANRVQQLAYAMAHVNEYLNHINSTKGLDKISGITFKISVGTNYFFEISKLRALRILWKTLAAEYHLSFDCRILAIPTKRNKTLYDYNVNMLRTTTESMAAVIGGADVVCNQAYDAIYHKDNEFGERIALNQLLLLKNESYFDKVNNASDGAYYIENLTFQLSQKALLLFKEIEKDGGFLSQLKKHTIQRKIKENAQKQQEKFNSRNEVLVGTNAYLNENDKIKDNLELYPFVKQLPRKTLLEPIIEKRLAETLEKNRLQDE